MPVRKLVDTPDHGHYKLHFASHPRLPPRSFPAMSKKKSGKSTSQIQRELEQVDRSLVKLLEDRAKVAVRLAAAKKEEGLPLFDLAEESQMVQAALAAHKGPLGEHTVRAIARELVAGCRLLSRTVKVAYLGPQYSYSYQAAVHRFGSTAELIPVATISAVFAELGRGQVEFGIVPIENSTDGRIVDTLDNLARKPQKICGEVPLRIHHNLLAKCPRADIQEVYSKPQALSQCREWLSKHLPLARLVEMTSTAAAAKLAVDKYGAAAVASLQAATNYGLTVIEANIEDNKHNLTRFAVIGDHPSKRTGRDKTALMFELHHKPGALADAMAIFKHARLNLTWIESFPMPNSPNEYLFFVELEGHQSEARVERALEALRRKTVRLEILGSYPKAEPIE